MMNDDEKMIYCIEDLYHCSKELGESTMYIEQVYANIEDNLSIYVHQFFNKPHIDDIYFILCDNVDITKATRLSRIKLFKAKYKYINDNSIDPFILNDLEKFKLIQILNKKYNECVCKGFNGTNWEYILDLYNYCGFGNPKMRNLLKKAKNKIPDYTKL